MILPKRYAHVLREVARRERERPTLRDADRNRVVLPSDFSFSGVTFLLLDAMVTGWKARLSSG